MVDLKKIPSNPGCYLFKDHKGIILYIGKAKDLKKRVSSYFQKKDHDQKTLALVGRIATVDFIVTRNEVEALILENNLIKQHQPKYNIDLKDAKRFAYIHVTEEDYPRLLVARDRALPGKYIGPFTSAEERNTLIGLCTKIFHLRTCKHLPGGRMCDRHHFACQGPCLLGTTQEEYGRRVSQALFVLHGNTEEIMQSLEKDMAAAKKELAYEKAIKIRDQITALSHLSLRQTMQRDVRFDEDIIDYTIVDGKVFLLVFHIDRGTLTGKQEYAFDWNDDFFDEFLIQYYADRRVPKELILRQHLDESVHSFLEEKRGGKVTVTIPLQGEKRQLLELAKKNIEISFFGEAIKLEELKKSLRLQTLPRRIECFDISHLSGTAMVGSMVSFLNGKADKKNYRRFKIRTVEQIDDFAAIKEVVSRRYIRIIAEQGEMPDLIIIDGGKGQLSSAQEALKDAGAIIPVISLAKRFEEVYVPGLEMPLRLDPKGKALLCLREIRDEAHRFAISYNRLLRKKALTEGLRKRGKRKQ
jgi:excinuclease ABC subunit C